jgi:hypothetical protein
MENISPHSYSVNSERQPADQSTLLAAAKIIVQRAAERGLSFEEATNRILEEPRPLNTPHFEFQAPTQPRSDHANYISSPPASGFIVGELTTEHNQTSRSASNFNRTVYLSPARNDFQNFSNPADYTDINWNTPPLSFAGYSAPVGDEAFNPEIHFGSVPLAETFQNPWDINPNVQNASISMTSGYQAISPEADDPSFMPQYFSTFGSYAGSGLSYGANGVPVEPSMQAFHGSILPGPDNDQGPEPLGSQAQPATGGRKKKREQDEIKGDSNLAGPTANKRKKPKYANTTQKEHTRLVRDEGACGRCRMQRSQVL